MRIFALVLGIVTFTFAVPARAERTVLLVADSGGFDDASFNAAALAGATRARDELGIRLVTTEMIDAPGFNPNALLGRIASVIGREDPDLVILNGFTFGEVTPMLAMMFPRRQFAIIDFPDFAGLPNLRGMLFDVDEPSLAAGYLAAGMAALADPDGAMVQQFGGFPIPPVTQFMVGFASGVALYNAEHGAGVGLLEEPRYACGFGPPDGIAPTSAGLAAGADVIFPVAGGAMLGAVEMILAHGGAALIGVDVDAAALPQLSEAARALFVTSVVKRVDLAVYRTIADLVAGSPWDDYVGTLANGGVGIAPYHAFEGVVPAELDARVGEILEAVAAGELSTGWEGQVPEPTACDTIN